MALRNAATLIPPSTWQGSWVARRITRPDAGPAQKLSGTLIPTETTKAATADPQVRVLYRGKH